MVRVVIVFILLGIIGVVGFFAVLNPIKVVGRSMEPNYKNGETFLVNNLAYKFNSPQRGDVVMFSFSSTYDFQQIGRVVGMPGDKLMIYNGLVWVNSQPLEEKYLSEEYSTQTQVNDFVTNGKKFLEEGQEIFIPEDNYFMMGDNRTNSLDSRTMGLAQKNNIFGKVLFRYKLGN